MTNNAIAGRREPILVVAVALFLFELVWFAINFEHPVGPPILGSVPAIGAAGVLVTAYWRTARSPGLPAGGRRFWRTLTLAALAMGAVSVAQIPDVARGVAFPVNLASNIGNMASLIILLVAVYRLPLGLHQRGQRLRLTLDVVTVILAAVLFAWYLSLAPVAGNPSRQLLVSTAVSTVLLGLAGLAVVKVVMADSGVIDRIALRLFATGALFETLCAFGNSLLGHRPQVSAELIGRTVLAICVALASQHQRRARPATDAARPRRQHRSFSVLPYVAVASVDVLLLITMVRARAADQIVGGTVVLLTALVTARQLAAFRDNARLLEELARQEQRFRSLVQNAADVIAICDPDGTVLYVSPAIETLTGRPASYWTSRGQIDAVDPEDGATIMAGLREVSVAPGRTTRVRTRLTHADGGLRWIEMNMANQLDVPGVAGIVLNLTDITARETYHRQLSHQASHDALTDLANRSLFGDTLTDALARSSTEPLRLALIDLDDFKSVNDTLGHQAGDALLIAVAERLRRGVRPPDLVARLGGDEFAVLLENIAEAKLAAVIERLMTCLTEPLELAGHQIAVRASVGIADARPGEDADGLVSRADLAMYEAKASGKGRYLRYSDSMRPRDAAATQLTMELFEALAHDQFELHYQPIVALPDGRWVGVEALLRWRHPQRGLIPPLDFIPQAEATGAIVPIGRWVLRAACQEAARWHAEFPDTAPAILNVNVSPRQLMEPSFVDDVRAALADSGLPGACLMIEVTESTLADQVTAVQHLQAVRAWGVRISLDDFGTGQSTLSLLDICPVDQLKLDRSFIPIPGRDSMAVAVVHIAEALGTELVAEGVETPDHVARLTALGYRLAQGFYFSRPLPGRGISESLASRTATRVRGG